MIRLTRRRFLLGSALGASAFALTGCDALEQNAELSSIIGSAEKLTMRAQRLLLGRNALAREFAEADISPSFRVNGTSAPDSEEYAQLLEGNFASWRLQIDGLVERPQAFSLAELKALPARSQITRHDCVEGWSAIAQWTGVPLGSLLTTVGLKPTARFAVFHCADELEKTLDGSGQYYESIDLIDAFHPQTILAYAMNGRSLSVGHGAPLRLRVERQLGYKQAKYVMRLEAVEDFRQMGRGNGGFWEDRGYEWYGGI